YVEPFLPRPLLALVGHGPVLETLAALAEATGFEVAALAGEARPGDMAWGPRTSVVVATHGDADEEALERALLSDAGYVSLIASRKRAAVVIENLRQRGVPAGRHGRIKAPAGLDIGAVTPEEIAVSILAEIVQSHRSVKPGSQEDEAAP